MKLSDTIRFRAQNKKRLREMETSSIDALSTYFPTSQSMHSRDEYSQHIIGLKNNHNSSISFWFKKVWYYLEQNNLKDHFVVSCPSSKYGVSSTGVSELARRLNKGLRNNNHYYFSRDEQITPAHLGGRRDESLHVRTIRLNSNRFNHHFNKILIIDDVVTSGATMNACKKIAKCKGVQCVRCLGLGRTNSLSR